MAYNQFTDNNCWDDTMVSPTTQRTGTVAPTLETGFRGNANFQMISFISSQADETQFVVQFPHGIKLDNTKKIYPHVHFAPEENIVDGTYNVQFILEYYWTNINAQFGSGASSYTMTKNFTVVSNDHIWMHWMASNSTGIAQTGNISSIMVCRLYRDNAVANNYTGKVAILGFDIHYLKDGLGSLQITSKT